jgi:hypothetical protein
VQSFKKASCRASRKPRAELQESLVQSFEQSLVQSFEQNLMQSFEQSSEVRLRRVLRLTIFATDKNTTNKNTTNENTTN